MLDQRLYIYLTVFLGTGSGSSSRGVDALVVTVESGTYRGCANAAVLPGTYTDNAVVNGTGDTVGNLDIDLGKHILLVDAGLADITDGSSLDHVTDAEALDGLILSNHTVAVGTADGLHMATATLVTSVRSSLLRHLG